MRKRFPNTLRWLTILTLFAVAIILPLIWTPLGYIILVGIVVWILHDAYKRDRALQSRN